MKECPLIPLIHIMTSAKHLSRQAGPNTEGKRLSILLSFPTHRPKKRKRRLKKKSLAAFSHVFLLKTVDVKNVTYFPSSGCSYTALYSPDIKQFFALCILI